jgi:hypothetical protein
VPTNEKALGRCSGCCQRALDPTVDRARHDKVADYV